MIRVDGERLQRSIEELAQVGATAAGGVERVALTPADVEARALLAGWLDRLDCEQRTDRIGNRFARRAGAEPERAPVLIGSHLDSQPDGGRHDGALGVLCALEVLRTLEDNAIVTAAPVELANWTDEEGARFDVSCVGSSVHAGALALEHAYALVDADGTTLEAALRAAGELGDAPIGGPADAYFEVHIEQGPVLERRGTPIGAVEAIQSVRWLEVTFTGASTHAGSTPVADRRDALLAAAKLIVATDRIAAGAGPEARAGACQLTATPNAGSVIAGGARVLVDLRHPEDAQVEAMERELRDAAAAIGADAGVAHELRHTWLQPRIEFDPGCVALVEQAAAGLGLPSWRMISRAGHDAGYLAGVVPSAMIFVPCRDGVSHHPDEHVEPEHAEAAANVLLAVVLERAGT